jgi:hypothetical protein
VVIQEEENVDDREVKDEEQVDDQAVQEEEKVDNQVVGEKEKMDNQSDEEKDTDVQQEIPPHTSHPSEKPQKNNPPPYPERLLCEEI